MTDDKNEELSFAERWYREQQAWQKTMRDYADAAATDENFLMHMGNAMRGSLLAGAPYPTASAGADGGAGESSETLAEILFTLKRIEGRLVDLEAALEDCSARIGAAAHPSASDA